MKKNQPLFRVERFDFYKEASFKCRFIGSLVNEIMCTKGYIKSCIYPSKMQQPYIKGVPFTYKFKYTGIAFVKIEGINDLCIGRFLCHEYKDGTHDQFSFVYKRGDEMAKKEIDQVFKDLEDAFSLKECLKE
jgi:hypothetical protein